MSEKWDVVDLRSTHPLDVVDGGARQRETINVRERAWLWFLGDATLFKSRTSNADLAHTQKFYERLQPCGQARGMWKGHLVKTRKADPSRQLLGV
jgi:outer membrane protein assembly factor BamA